jgi:hypothetical protein
MQYIVMCRVIRVIDRELKILPTLMHDYRKLLYCFTASSFDICELCYCVSVFMSTCAFLIEVVCFVPCIKRQIILVIT